MNQFQEELLHALQNRNHGANKVQQLFNVLFVPRPVVSVSQGARQSGRHIRNDNNVR